MATGGVKCNAFSFVTTKHVHNTGSSLRHKGFLLWVAGKPRQILTVCFRQCPRLLHEPPIPLCFARHTPLADPHPAASSFSEPASAFRRLERSFSEHGSRLDPRAPSGRGTFQWEKAGQRQRYQWQHAGAETPARPFPALSLKGMFVVLLSQTSVSLEQTSSIVCFAFARD